MTMAEADDTTTPHGHAHPSPSHAYSSIDLSYSSPDRAGMYFMDVEIDQCEGQLLCNATPDKNSKINLLSYQEAPAFVKDNPYVRHGYRAFLPFSGCIKSLFTWSNESINIWSHLLGFLLFFILMICDNVMTLPNIDTSFSDHLIMTTGLVCFQFCMLCSAGYHVFNCHSERASRRWLMADIAGICVGLIGCYLPAVHFAFYCAEIWRNVYLLVVSALCLGVLYVQLNPRFFSRNPNLHWRTRVLLFMALVCYGIIPVFHWVYLNGGWSSPLVQVFAPKVAVMYLLGALAFFMYVTRLPERCLPGRVDFVGSSHQWWHLLVVVAFIYWHNAGYQFLAFRTENRCPARS